VTAQFAAAQAVEKLQRHVFGQRSGADRGEALANRDRHEVLPPDPLPATLGTEVGRRADVPVQERDVGSIRPRQTHVAWPP
jgi:hypothetical protein